MKQLLIVFLMMCLAFAIGFMIQTVQMQTIEKRLTEVETKLSILQGAIVDGGL